MRKLISRIAIAAALSSFAFGLAACSDDPDEMQVRQVLDFATKHVREDANNWKKTPEAPSLANHQSASIMLVHRWLYKHTIKVTRDRWGAHFVAFTDDDNDVNVSLKEGVCNPVDSATPNICTFLSADEWKGVYQTFYNFGKKNDPAV